MSHQPGTLSNQTEYRPHTSPQHVISVIQSNINDSSFTFPGFYQAPALIIMIPTIGLEVHTTPSLSGAKFRLFTKQYNLTIHIICMHMQHIHSSIMT